MTTPDSHPRSDAPDATLNIGKLPGPLLDRLVDTYRTAFDPEVLVMPGYGRDAAAIDVGGASPIIVKSDPITFATDGATRYLVAVNSNDIACLGGIPRWLSVVLLLPEKIRIRDVEAMFADLQVACNDAGVSVIGGHTEVTPIVTRPVFIGTMLGIAGPRGVLVPGGAMAGDDLLLTKWIGIEGTALLARERTGELTEALGAAVTARAAKLLRHPGIDISADAQAVLEADGVTALHDPTEGGIATAIHELASASGCGAEILASAMPVLPETAAICNHFGIDPLGLLSSGALLVAVKPHQRSTVERSARERGIAIAHIGKMTDSNKGITMIGDEGRANLPRFDSDEVARVL